ncbi:pyrimidine 5'-nucleotidase-domain-containing protein [Sporodiniella umbellata]|nr:pyrimidine 5'-nucleotidase-domain-containing protein [Sporodiniella umbellata]
MAKALVERLLLNPTVRIQNLARTSQKLSKILKDGRDQVHFISDFDMTMSIHWVRNKKTDAFERNVSSHGLPAKYEKLNGEFKTETARIYNTFYPIEINQSMTHEEKVPYMVQWWTEAHALLVQQKLTKEDLSKMTEQHPVELRKGVDRVIHSCHKQTIPFLVFSAGIGDIIENVLRKAELYYQDTMHIVSNGMVFKDNVCVDFKAPLIHVFNKSEFQLETSPYYAQIQHRANVILMGDSLGDLQMSQGVAHSACLTIGFLNHDIATLGSKYTDAFDIVIVGDANMDPVYEILDSF